MAVMNRSMLASSPLSLRLDRRAPDLSPAGHSGRSWCMNPLGFWLSLRALPDVPTERCLQRLMIVDQLLVVHYRLCLRIVWQSPIGCP